MSAFFPKNTWLATGGKNGASWKNNPEVIKPLSNRKILLYPDLGAYEQWKEFKQKLESLNASVILADVLEKHFSHDKDKGYDIADYMLEGNGKPKIVGFHSDIERRILLNKYGYPAQWDKPKNAKEAYLLMAVKNPVLNKLTSLLDLEVVSIKNG